MVFSEFVREFFTTETPEMGRVLKPDPQLRHRPITERYFHDQSNDGRAHRIRPACTTKKDECHGPLVLGWHGPNFSADR